MTADSLPYFHFAVDAFVWCVSVPFAVWLRFDFDTSQLGAGTLRTIAAAVGLQAIVGTLLGQYRAQWRYGTFEEVVVVALTAAIVGVALTVLFWGDGDIPRSVPLLATGITLLAQVSIRSFWRLYNQRQRIDHTSQRLVIVGAGEGGSQILRNLRSSSDSRFAAVALLDDDPNKRDLRLSGVRVRGRTTDLAAVVDRHPADAVLIAIPSAEPAFIRRVTADAEVLGLAVYILPPLEQMLGGGYHASDIRSIKYTDLLGRRPADIDTEAIAEYISGRRVLVTGAGGSIGSELCRQLARFEPSELLMLDRDESGLHTTQLSLEGRALLDDPNLILADIRDEARINEVFAEYRPDVVFHTAALKHLPLLEAHPDEGWKTNVCGTLNLLRSAAAHGIDRFVNISTDKAANPTSVLGWTKRTTERLTAWANSLGQTQFVSVRFGNVLGSNGSVVKAFEAQSAQGGPITVTHPDVTRYFMTVEEASRLTIYAGAIGDPGEVMILDMGEPVRIMEVAERFAAEHDPPLEIVFTGLRPTEKLHEDLISDSEIGEAKHHPLITHVDVPPLELPEQMGARAAPSAADLKALAEWPSSLVPSPAR